MLFTRETIIVDTASVDAALCAYAKLFGVLHRRLFAAIARKEDPGKLKPGFCKEHKITARQFNAIHRETQGKLDAVEECRKGQIDDLTRRVRKAQEGVDKLAEPGGSPAPAAAAGRARRAAGSHA